ncbi:hypothetical protein HispidOSU_026898 [Sigmodon hispidus]
MAGSTDDSQPLTRGRQFRTANREKASARGDWPVIAAPSHVTATPGLLLGSFRTFPPVTVLGRLLGAGPWAGTVARGLKGGSLAAGLPVPVRRRSRSPALQEDVDPSGVPRPGALSRASAAGMGQVLPCSQLAYLQGTEEPSPPPTRG